MDGWTTVFAMDRWSNGVLADMLFRLAIGVVALAGGLWAVLRKDADTGARTFRSGPAFLVAWAVLWLGLHLIGANSVFAHIARLTDAIDHGHVATVEGVVQVGHVQPATGHSRGDEVRIGERNFEINYFVATPAYRDSIEHGGALTPGTFARVGYVDGDIVRVEVKAPAATLPR